MWGNILTHIGMHHTSHPLDVLPPLNVPLPPNQLAGCCMASFHAATI